MNAVKLLAIVTVTAAVTLLCIRSGQAMAKNLVPAETVYRPTDGKPEFRGKLLTVAATASAVASTAASAAYNATTANFTAAETTDPIVATATTVDESTTAVASNVSGTVSPGTAVAPDDVTANRGGPGTNATAGPGERERTPKNATSRALADGARHEVRSSRSRTPPIVIRGKLIKNAPRPTDRYGENSVTVAVDDDAETEDDNGETDNETNIKVDTEVYHANRPYYRQMVQNDYSTIDTDIWVAEEDGSAGYHNAYDLTYDRENSDGAGPPPSGHAVGMGRPTYGSVASSYPYSAGVGYKQQYGAPRLPVAMIHHNMMNYPAHGANGQAERFNVHNTLHQIQTITDKIDWHKVGVLAFFKLGLAKLKAFGFLKILFLLVFKLKLFLIAMFFKFLLIMKLMKFFKLLMVPLILLSLLPLMSTIASPMLVGGLLSIPSRIIDYLTGPVYAPAGTNVATKYAAGAADPAVLPGAAAASAAKAAGWTVPALFRLGDWTAPDVRRLDALQEKMDPSISLFRRMLDTEKCVERIGCRMAVVEKAGILPAWVNWVLHRVAKLVPNEKLESYLKTYDDVNDAISSEPETAFNWATWCLERYACNGVNTTNAIGARQ